MSNSQDEPSANMDDIKESIRLLTQLALRADERMDALEEAQTNSERKIAALADAQISTEAIVARLSTIVEDLAARMSELALAQTHTDQRLDALIDIVRERLGGQPQA